MSTQVEFLLLENNAQLINTAIGALLSLNETYERILVLANDRLHLMQMDEMLWHNSAKQFIPYSLDSECYSLSAKILLTDNQPAKTRFQVLLNLGAKMSLKPAQFHRIIELVNADELSKEQAREKYKQYRSNGFLVSHREIKN